MPKVIEEHAMKILWLKKEKELLFWILDNTTEVVCFWDNVRKCNIAHSVDLVELCFLNHFLFIVKFFSFFN